MNLSYCLRCDSQFNVIDFQWKVNENEMKEYAKKKKRTSVQRIDVFTNRKKKSKFSHASKAYSFLEF